MSCLPLIQPLYPALSVLDRPAARPSRGSILLVEADAGQHSAAAATLGEVGFSVTTAACAAACQQAVRSHLPDLILLSTELPDMTGFELCERLRANPAATGAVIIHLFNDPADGEEPALSLESGADGCIPRALPGPELVARVDAMLRVCHTEAELRRVTAELRAATRTLDQGRQRSQSLFDLHPDSVFSIDLQGRLLTVNAATEKLSGFTAEELQGMPFQRLVVPEHLAAAEAQFARTLAGEAVTDEFLTLRCDGRQRLASITSLPIVVDGEIVGVYGVSRDVTERREQEVRLRESEERCREQAALLDCAQEAIFVQDLTGRILYWNKSAESIYGCGAEEAVGQVFTPHAIGASAAHDAAREAVIENGIWVGELTEYTPAGREIIVEAHWTIVRDARDSPKSILCINTDITERKRLESQFLRAQRLESIGTLAGGIAHDLNNVLSPIMLSIELLKIQHPDAVTLEILDTIQTSARHGADMVKQVFSFARGVEGQRLLVQPKYLLKDIQKISTDTFPKSIQLKVQAAPDLWNVLGDPTQLHQVLLNLCVNARDAMPQGGSISITAENVVLDAHYAAMNIEAQVGPHVVLNVVDNGTGMTAEVREKIFDPFFTTKELGKGTGLGLSSSLAIVKSHGGFIRVYSEPGKGTSFKVHLPAQTSAQELAAEIAAESAAPDLPRGHGQTVLIIDDEASIRTITQQTLEAFGYRTMLAADGAEAVALYAQHQAEIAVVLTDMMMPVMDGPATIQVLTRINPRVRVIAVSGMAATGQFVREGHTAARYFLPKPYTAEAMLRTLAATLAAEV